MRFALLGDDRVALPIIRALIDRVDEHQLNYVVQANRRLKSPFQGDPSITFVELWEDLPIENQLDAVIVAGNDQATLDGAKQIAAAGIPILFVPRTDQGSTYIYELSLIRDDNHVPLVPMFWHRFDAATVHLKNLIHSGQLGKVQFLQLDRGFASESTNAAMTQSNVDGALLPDTDLVRWLIGDYDHVTCLRTGATTDGVLMQSVVLAGRSLPEANWSISPVVGSDRWRLTVRGEDGTAELYRDGTSHNWICELNGLRIEGDDTATARSILQSFTGLVTSQSSGQMPRENSTDVWTELVKCFETVDATQRSIKRRRTIELHFEPMSERAIFKTQMTAIGCGLLVATFLMTLVFLGISSAIPLPERVLEFLRILVFAPLILFLIAQVLLPLTRPSSREQSSAS